MSYQILYIHMFFFINDTYTHVKVHKNILAVGCMKLQYHLLITNEFLFLLYHYKFLHEPAERYVFILYYKKRVYGI